MLTTTPEVADPVYVKYRDLTCSGNINIIWFDSVNELTCNQVVGEYRDIEQHLKSMLRDLVLDKN